MSARRDVVVAIYKSQDASKARAHRDQLKAEGKDAFLTMGAGLLRHAGYYLVHVNPPDQDDAGVGQWLEAAAAARASDNLPPPLPAPPYPFCRYPKVCAGRGYCTRDPACNN